MHFHYVFLCRNCSIPIWLHSETLGRPFEPQGVRSSNALSIAVVCPHCKNVRSYSLAENSPDYDPKGTVVSADHIADTVPYGLLECDAEDCKTRLPLVGVKSISTDDAKKKAELNSWNWDGLKCPTGHPISRPR
jgi:hypothetical protein